MDALDSAGLYNIAGGTHLPGGGTGKRHPDPAYRPVREGGLHTRNPWNVEYADYYRQFYHIPDQVTLVILPAGSYECWPDVDPEQWERRLEFFPSKDYTPSLP